MIKHKLLGLLAVFTACSLWAAAPASPQAFVPSGVTTAVTTNAVSAPAGFFAQALVYAPTNIFKPSTATLFSWTPSSATDLAGYRFYYGDLLTASTFPRLEVNKTVSGVILLGLNTNTVYGFYVTAYNTAAEESAPSTLVVLKPGTLTP